MVIINYITIGAITQLLDNKKIIFQGCPYPRKSGRWTEKYSQAEVDLIVIIWYDGLKELSINNLCSWRSNFVLWQGARFR
jgi:hypothetical protein